MRNIHCICCYFSLFFGIQLVIMTLLTREVNQKRLSNFTGIFHKEPTLSRNHRAANFAGEDVFTNLSHLSMNGEDMPHCPETSPLLRGPINVNFRPELVLAQVQRKNPLVVSGGQYRPRDCEARNKTAIIIPHRYREHHLKYLLYYLHPFLQRQQLHYKIYVVHQAGSYTFNKAMLMNAGFLEAMKEEDWDCIYFHDVDLIPEDDRNTYVCNSNPKHSAVAIDKFDYKLPYLAIFGGVTALTPAQFLKINGFPNKYWGWGGEDDDIGSRVILAGMQVSRPSMELGRYKMIKHELDKGNYDNSMRFKMLDNTGLTWRSDGINTLNCEIVSRESLPLYTNITINVGTEAGLLPPSSAQPPSDTL